MAFYCLLLVLISAGLIRFGIERYEIAGEGWGSTGPIMLGLALLPFPLVSLIQALFAIRGQAKLLAGIGVIARWQVYPDEWKRFRGLDDRRSAEDVSLGNDLWIRKASPSEPVGVIVGERSALVDGSYHSLKPGGLPDLRSVRWLDGPPTSLEFSLLYPRGRHGRTVPTTLRIPVPASARGEARRVVAHYERITCRTPGIALRNPQRTYWICALLVLGAAVGGIAWLAFSWADPQVRVGLLVGASVLGAFAAILALVDFLVTRRA